MSFFISAPSILSAQEKKIGNIIIIREDIFTSPAPYNQFPYSWVNQLHVVTNEAFIRTELLFKEGDNYDQAIIEETERRLRTRPVFRSVAIVTEESDEAVNVIVHTKDVWSTTIQTAYGVAGGKNLYRLGILEHNVLGTGKSLGGFIRQDIDRFVKGISYEDPQLFGSRLDFKAGYGEDEKGKEWEVSLANPYYSSLTPHAEGVRFIVSEDEDRLFENGEEVAHFQHDQERTRVFGSLSLGPTQEATHRVTLAHEWEDHEFYDYYFGIPKPVPMDRTLSVVLLEYDFHQYDYVKKKGVQTFERIEDLNFGWDIMVGAGPSLEALGATTDGVIGRGKASKMHRFAHGQIGLAEVMGETRLEHGHLQNGILSLNFQYMNGGLWPGSHFYIRNENVVGKNLDPENQFLLGGENGLRGYSVRQFSGNKKFLLSLENRQPILYDWLHLVSMGWAIFADIGRTWDEGDPVTFESLKSDVGAGLRFSPTRSFNSSIIRVDLAYALDENNRSSQWVFNIGIDLNFRFGRDDVHKFDQ